MNSQITNADIALPLGWHIEIDDSRDDGSLQAFVFSPSGDSCSLAFARDVGMTSGANEEPIPARVLEYIGRKFFDKYE
jgi:hypothetical protein